MKKGLLLIAVAFCRKSPHRMLCLYTNNGCYIQRRVCVCEALKARRIGNEFNK